VLCTLVPSVVDSLGDAFPELKEKTQHVVNVVREEEESFLRTLDRGIALFDDAAERAKEKKSTTIAADDAFQLHDTYGFPIDLTRVMAEERGMTVDEAGFERLMEEARERSRQGGDGEEGHLLPPEAIDKLRTLNVDPTDDDPKYDPKPINARIVAIWDGAGLTRSARSGDQVSVVLDRTNHYGEAGGQIGDEGMIYLHALADEGSAPRRGYGSLRREGNGQFRVVDTQRCGPYVLHTGELLDGEMQVGDPVKVVVDLNRRNHIVANHTGTHLLNHALRDVLGDEVQQKGSLVAPDRLRFDFASPHAMSAAEVERAQTHVRGQIEEGLFVYDEVVPIELARDIHGLRAVFGEKYPDNVRVVSVGQPVKSLLDNPDNPEWRGYSVEFCGGTHLVSTDEATAFAIVSEQALAAGIRRIVALTGPAARAAIIAGRQLEADLKAALDRSVDDASLVEEFDDLNARFEHLTLSVTAKHRLHPMLDELRDRVKHLRKQQQAEARSGAVDQAREIAEEAGDAYYIVARIDDAEKDTLLSALDVVKSKRPSSAVMLLSPNEEEGKVAIAAAVPKDLIAKGLKAGDWVREAAKVCGGGGGGRPDMAQAGGKDPSKLQDAMEAASGFAESKLAD
jgi:alanyl-tRNA synthetase